MMASHDNSDVAMRTVQPRLQIGGSILSPFYSLARETINIDGSGYRIAACTEHRKHA